MAARITASSVAVVLLSFSSFEPLFLCISFRCFSLSLPSTKQSDEPTNDYCSSARNERTRRKNGTERERNNVDDATSKESSNSRLRRRRPSCQLLMLLPFFCFFKVARWQNLIWIVPPCPPSWRNPRKGRDHILQLQRSGVIVQKPEGPNTYDLKIWL